MTSACFKFRIIHNFVTVNFHLEGYNRLEMKKPSTPLGTYDAFKDAASWDSETARMWVAALNLRATAADQIALRNRLFRLANLKQGDTAIEIGSGTGALLCDLARAVGEGGKAIGIEPQIVLAEAARARILSENLSAIVKTESAERLSLESETADACLAQTVLIHLPPDILQQTLAEMTRVVRRGGRVISCDQDGDTWTIDHPDRELTRRIVRFNSDQRYADGWTGRRLYRFFRTAGLKEVEIETLVQTDTEKSLYLFGMAERIANAAAEVGEISLEESLKWLEQLNESAAADHFFSSINYYICVGVRGS